MSVGQSFERLLDKVFSSSIRRKNIKIGKLKAPFIEIEDFEMKSHDED